MKCSVSGCSRIVDAKGFCYIHYYYFHKYGDPLTKPKIRKRGDGTVTAGGYRQIGINKKRLYEHRVVMEKFLGRPLKTTEQIHHLDHNRLNNDISNLIVIPNYLHTQKHMTKYFVNKTHKQCHYCLEIKPHEFFYKHFRSKHSDNCQGICKQCHPVAQRNYRKYGSWIKKISL